MAGCSVAAGVTPGDSSRKEMSLVQAGLRARGWDSATFRETCAQNKLVNHLRSSSHNEGPKKQKTFFSENIHRQGNSPEVRWVGLHAFIALNAGSISGQGTEISLARRPK